MFLTQLADALTPRPPQWATPGDLATHLNPHTVNTPALRLIDDALIDAYNTPDSRLIISMAPQEGKSLRVAQDYPIWALTQNPDTRIVTASYGQSLATRNGRTIRNRITAAPDLGLAIAPDNGSASEWQLTGHAGGVYSVGVGGGMTGRSADMLIIDDPVKDRSEADSPTYRDRVWEWWTDVASTRLTPGAPVIIIMTRWHHDDLAGRLLAAPDGDRWRYINIPAQADHRPEHGETDILGREPGEYMVSARGRTQTQWEQRKLQAGSKTWASLYQGRPTPDTGGIFPPSHEWPTYTTPVWVTHDDGRRTIPHHSGDMELIQSWDLAFKDTNGSDYVVGQVWLRIGAKAMLVDMVRDRMNFTATCQAIRTLSARWPQATAKFVEDKANGPAVIQALRHQVPGIVPVEPQGSKTARASAVAPFLEAGNVHIPSPDLLPSVADLMSEADGFPNAAHDDTVDALTQALNRLLLHPLTQGRSLTTEDVLPDYTPVNLNLI